MFDPYDHCAACWVTLRLIFDLLQAAFFARDDVSYRGFAKYYSKMADEAREHAKKLQDYVVTRGGRVHFKSIPVGSNYFFFSYNV